MNRKKFLCLCAVLVAVLLGSSLLYQSLADQVSTGGLATVPAAPEPEESVEESTEAPSRAPTEVTETQPTDPPDTFAPDFPMQDWEGNEVTLMGFVGKPMILNFWASWCGPCKMEMPDLEKAYIQYGEQIHFLMVNCTGSDTMESAKAYIESEGYTFPVYFDTTSLGAYTYGASSIPLTFFIDAQGHVVAYYMGAMSANILQQGIDLIYTPAAE